MRLKKKSSLSLSINAIVILVLAISMLGLGLGFTKSMFAKFGSALKVPEPENPATEDDPIALPATTIEGKDEKAFGFAVSIYNKASSVAGIVVLPPTCSGGDPFLIEGGFTAADDVTIEPKSTVSAKFLIDGAPVGYANVCTITAEFTPTTGDPWSISRQVSLVVE